MYDEIVSDILKHPKVQEMKGYNHHDQVDCLTHSLHVSRVAYQVTKKMGLDYRSTARGALLHDFYLYDWHIKGSHKGLHGFNHAELALKNADLYFELNDLERDIILKHMWPLNFKFPNHLESYLVMVIDKYCSTIEIVNSLWRRLKGV